MRNDGLHNLDTLSVEQTEALLAAFDGLPINAGAARRIRRRVQKQAAPKRRRRQTALRIATPIAACLVALVALALCFPQAAQAIAAFLGLPYTPSRYMQQQPAEREAVPSVDEALAAAAPKDGDYTITLLPEWEDAAEFVEYREKNGYEPFREEDWAWLRDIRPVIGEVLYDGEVLIWNTHLYTDSDGVRAFMGSWSQEKGPRKRVDALMDSSPYTVEGDPTVRMLYPGGHGIQPLFDEEAISSAEYVVLYGEMTWSDDERPPDGLITVTQHFFICENDAMDYGAMVARVEHTFTFDTTAGNQEAAEPASFLVPLSGDCDLTVWDWTKGNHTVVTKTVPLDGVSLGVELHYMSTGIRVNITVAEAPADWTEAMKNSLMQVTQRNIYDKVDISGIYADLYIGGQFVSEAPQPDSWGHGELPYVLPVFPDQYQSSGEVVLKLTYASQATLNDADLSTGEVLPMPQGGINGTTKSMPLVDIVIPLP